ncbi:MAG: hypothetical protein AB1353_01030 [Aquificota bacterium]
MVRVIYSLFILTVALLVSSCGGGFGGVSSSLLENPKPDFSISLNPNTLSVQAGQSTNTTLTITPQFGFSGNVALSLEREDGSPCMIGLSPSSVNVGRNNNFQLTLSVPSSLPTGTYRLSLKATSGDIVKRASITIVVSETPPPPPPVGENWIPQNSGTTLPLWGASCTSGKYVVVGGGRNAQNQYEAVLLYSTDGTNWQRAQAPQGTETNTFYGVVYGNGFFVAVGYNGSIIASQDGINWVRVNHNLTTKTLYRVAYINGYFVAMGQNGTILVCNANTSDCRQGASWSLKTSGTTQTLEWLIHDGQRYVMVGNGGTVLTSSDLNTWTNANANFGGDTPNLWGIAYINGRYVAVSNNNNKVYLSQDLSVWTSPYTAQQRLTFVLKVNDLLLATGDGGTILRSTDGGQSWTLANTGTSNKVNFVSDCESLLIAVGDGGTVLTSRR